MTDRELLQQWIKPGALVPITPDTTRILVEALRARLAQPEPYPENFIDALRFDAAQSEPTIDGWPLYSGLPPFSPSGGSKENESQKIYRTIQQREWVGLTDDEIDDIWSEFNDGYGIIEETLWGYERAIETKLREKNGF